MGYLKSETGISTVITVQVSLKYKSYCVKIKVRLTTCRILIKLAATMIAEAIHTATVTILLIIYASKFVNDSSTDSKKELYSLNHIIFLILIY